ncbi:MAG: thiamine pyrophosphate-dependent enzyme [Nitrospinales bacterium]
MNGTEAIRAVMSLVSDEAVVHANGYICRESFRVKDREANFYMIGSMGLASSIGLGAAMSRPDKKVIILDGDGNLLMSMGNLAMIASAAPANLVHVVIDNEVYESTGSQKTLSGSVRLEEIARASGYRLVRRASDIDTLKQAFGEMLKAAGPSFLLVKVSPSFDPATGRVTHSPEEIKRRFMKALAD